MSPRPARPRLVRCAHCGQPAPYGPDNPARPFCSLRCRSIDLGAWAAEGYRVAAPRDDGEPPAADPPDGTHH
ncbi:MAG: DNA gyrase inhibitor YacG [Burkholderiales bacterium]|nr:DNA gyrase inhibitor YacG [Burkholderiales bacterium]